MTNTTIVGSDWPVPLCTTHLKVIILQCKKVIHTEQLILETGTSTEGSDATEFLQSRIAMEKFVDSLITQASTAQLKCKVLTNFISTEIYLHVLFLDKYSEHFQIIVTIKNMNYARHCLTSWTHQDGESTKAFETLQRTCGRHIRLMWGWHTTNIRLIYGQNVILRLVLYHGYHTCLLCGDQYFSFWLYIWRLSAVCRLYVCSISAIFQPSISCLSAVYWPYISWMSAV